MAKMGRFTIASITLISLLTLISCNGAPADALLTPLAPDIPATPTYKPQITNTVQITDPGASAEDEDCFTAWLDLGDSLTSTGNALYPELSTNAPYNIIDPGEFSKSLCIDLTKQAKQLNSSGCTLEKAKTVASKLFDDAQKDVRACSGAACNRAKNEAYGAATQLSDVNAIENWQSLCGK